MKAGEGEMNVILGLLAGAMLAVASASAHAQAAPPGSYRESCRDIRMQGPTLTALCRRANGRGEQLTALDVAHCVGDIGNNNGNLACNGGQPARPVPPLSEAQYAPAPGYPAPGYAPPPRYGEGRGYWEHCQHLRHEEHELRDRLAYVPYGPEREQLQYRLGQVHAEREQCPRR
jgi:CVNH domain